MRAAFGRADSDRVFEQLAQYLESTWGPVRRDTLNGFRWAIVNNGRHSASVMLARSDLGNYLDIEFAYSVVTPK